MKCSACESNHKVTRFKGEIPLCVKHYKQMYRHGRILHRTTFDPNEIIIHDNYAEIVMYNAKCEESGRTKIDKEDIKKVKDRKWYMTDQGYAISDTKRKGELLHRLLTDCPEGKIVDHINRNSLDNRKQNLRICTQKENTFNSGIRTDNKTGHTGIVYRKREKKWFAYINKDGRQHSLGYHDTKEQAIKARKEGEVKYYGEFAPKILKGEQC